jgi:putative transposase
MKRTPRANRHSIRMKDYDYSQPGAYFVTICTQGRACLFGQVENDDIILNNAGWLVKSLWEEIPIFYPGADLGAYIVMPNHIHGIIFISGTSVHHSTSQERITSPSPTLGLIDVIHRFKSLTTRSYANGVKHMRWPAFTGRLWQRNYFEHVIRSQGELHRIQAYIHNNPARWISDRNNAL